MQGSSVATSDPGAPLSPEALPAQWSLALPALAVSGATDWADGWAARRFNQPSVIGSYLDPLADKVLICSVVGALGWSVSGPAPPVAPSCPELPWLHRDRASPLPAAVFNATMVFWNPPGSALLSASAAVMVRWHETRGRLAGWQPAAPTKPCRSHTSVRTFAAKLRPEARGVTSGRLLRQSKTSCSIRVPAHGQPSSPDLMPTPPGSFRASCLAQWWASSLAATCC